MGAGCDLPNDGRVSLAAAAHLAAMGPSARHRDPADLRAAVARLPEPVPATAAVRLTVWRRSF